MFTFTGKHPEWTVGGVASGFGLQQIDGQRRLYIRVEGLEELAYVTGNWTFWTSGTVAFQIDLDAANAA